ncbi:MAG TPA: hypothetical protein VFA10_14415 [Ktedonobacteraceae bacterium]|nr:hypothetical protein [Ktedonobacteraceae bacterium]
MDSKTTSISDNQFGCLEVEWLDYNDKPGMGTFKMLPDGTSRRLNGKHVSLVSPGNRWSKRVRLVNLSPWEALKLLEWLEAEKETLEVLAKESIS